MKLVHKVLGYLERTLLLISKNPEPVRPPVFIIGAPRSGTTLLYQVLANRYAFTYFTNYTAPFYRAPVIGFWLAKKLLRETPEQQDGDVYRSEHGRTRGPRGPHECGEFWYRWFPRGEHVYVAKGETTKKALKELRAEVLHVSRMMGASMLIKNVYNSMRIAPILEALPEAVFLVCRRDPAATAHSILRCRTETSGRKENWFSLPPKEIDRIKSKPYWEQVVEQVYYTYNQIEEDKRDFGAGKFLNIQYESFCRDVPSELSRIESFLQSADIEIVFRDAVPPSFPVSQARMTGSEDGERIKAAVKKLWNQG